MQDHTAGVDDPQQPRRDARAQPRRDPAAALFIVNDLINALLRDLLTDRLDDLYAAELLHHGRVLRLVDQLAYSRQG